MVARSPLWYLAAGLVLVLGIGLAGCGGGGGSASPEDEVKDVSADFIQALIDGEYEMACAMTTDADLCQGGLAAAEGLLPQGGYEALLGEDWRDLLEEADVTFADADHATVASLVSGGDEPTELVRQDGEWIIVVEEQQEPLAP